MARPTKQGVDYFPLDVQFDDKIELLIAEFGAEGLAVLITIWQIAYQNNGYFVDGLPDLSLLIKRRILVDQDRVDAIIHTCIRRNIFDENLFRKYSILTSRGIQNRYFIAARNKKKVEVFEDYVLNGVNVVGNAISYRELPTEKLVGNATKEEVEVEVEVEVKESPPLPPKGKKRGWPDDFILTETMSTYAKKQGIKDPVDEFEHFHCNALAKGYKYLNWEMAWQNWCRSPYQQKPRLIDEAIPKKGSGLPKFHAQEQNGHDTTDRPPEAEVALNRILGKMVMPGE